MQSSRAVNTAIFNHVANHPFFGFGLNLWGDDEEEEEETDDDDESGLFGNKYSQSAWAQEEDVEPEDSSEWNFPTRWEEVPDNQDDEEHNQEVPQTESNLDPSSMKINS